METTRWIVDPVHSDVQFKIKHLVISTITGSFNNFQGGATSDRENFEGAEIHFSLDVNSIDTNQFANFITIRYKVRMLRALQI